MSDIHKLTPKLFSKEFDLIFSIGQDCACTSYLRRANLQEHSYPFDWLTHAPYEQRFDLLSTNFDGFLQKENMELMEKPTHIPSDQDHDYYFDSKTNFRFYHDFPAGMDFDRAFQEVKEKYDRRISRLYEHIEKAKNILIVWWSKTNDTPFDLIETNWQKIQKKFKKKNIYFLHIEYADNAFEKYLCGKHVLVLKYDNKSYEHHPNWTMTLGHEENNEFIFSQIKLKRQGVKRLKKIYYHIGRFFIGLIPIKKVRRSVREAWKYKFYRNKL